MKATYNKIFALVAGLLVAAFVLLTQSWSTPGESEVDAPGAPTAEEGLPKISAPTEAIPVHVTAGLSVCFTFISELVGEVPRQEQLPPHQYQPVSTFLRTLAKAFVSPNAP